MASCITSKWSGTTSPQAQLTVTLNTSKSDGDTAALDWKLEYVAHGYAANTTVARDYTVTIAGTTVKTGTYDIDGVSSTKTIASGTHNVAKTASAKTISFGVSFEFALTWSGVYAGTRSASGSISIPAKTSYVVSYNANGGSGAPASQTKWFGTALTLSSTKPTRTGYSFQGWGTSASTTTVSYKSGASYTANAGTTLYAVWKANTYTVSYNANGGTGAPANQTKTYGKTLTLSSTKPTRTNYNFLGWGTSASTTTVSYKSGASYTANANVTLYAVWELAYRKPTITFSKAYRVDSTTGSQRDGGDWVEITNVNWTSFHASSGLEISWRYEGDSDWNANSIKTGALSGSVATLTIGNADLHFEEDQLVIIRLRVDDGKNPVEKFVRLNGSVYPIDVKAEGRGVSIGKAAELTDTFDVGWQTRFRDEVVSEHSDISFRQTHKTSGVEAGFGVGSGGTNHGFWSNLHQEEGSAGRWIIKYNGVDTTIASSYGEFRPYYRPGDTISSANIRTAGYVTNSSKDVSFHIPLSKPMCGVTSVTVTGTFTLRQGNNYTHGSSSVTSVGADSITTTRPAIGGVGVTATFSDVTNAINNDAIGIYWSGSITFN